MPEPTVAYRICPLCEACCGLTVELREGRVAAIRGDREDVFSAGYLCPKRGGPYGDQLGRDGLTLAKVKAAPHGIDLGPLRGDQLPDRLRMSTAVDPRHGLGAVQRVRRMVEDYRDQGVGYAGGTVAAGQSGVSGGCVRFDGQA